MFPQDIEKNIRLDQRVEDRICKLLEDDRALYRD